MSYRSIELPAPVYGTKLRDRRIVNPPEIQNPFISEVQYVEYTDGVSTWRKGVRDNCFVYDVEISVLGFDGIENVDWVNRISMSSGSLIQYLEYSDVIGTWRKGVRGGNFILDTTITELGFDGEEGVDWKNVRSLNN